MRLKFWKKPKYFDFSRARRRVSVTLNDFTALVATIAALISYIPAALGAGTIASYTIGTIAASAIVYGAASLALTTIMSALTSKSGEQGAMPAGGLMLYRKGR